MASNGKERLSIYIDTETKEKVVKASAKLGLTMNGFVNVCLENYFHQREALDYGKFVEKLVAMQNNLVTENEE